jgi:sugar/nucleoside kinase (ribokinase family)
VSVLVCGGIFREEIAGREPRLGGSGLVAALAAAGHDTEVNLAGWVGEDHAEELFALLAERRINGVAVKVLKGRTTTFRFSDPGDLMPPQPTMTEGARPPAEIPPLSASRVVLCIGTPGFDPVHARWLDRAAENATLLFDRQGSRSAIHGAAMAATVPAARRILLANTHEALAETGQATLAAATRRLPPDGYETAFVKAGPWGVLIRDRDGNEHPLGAHPLKARSTIGSGDVFAGALAARLHAGDDQAAAARNAAACAAAWVSCGEEHPPADLPARAALLGDAVWVDRRDLERRSFTLRGLLMDGAGRGRVERALRYLGVETQPAGHSGEPITLKFDQETDRTVSGAVEETIAQIRERHGHTGARRGEPGMI